MEVVCEEENWIAFFPLDPATAWTPLFLDHVADLGKWCHLSGIWMAAVIRVGRAIEASLKPDGMPLTTSAEQSRRTDGLSPALSRRSAMATRWLRANLAGGKEVRRR